MKAKNQNLVELIIEDDKIYNFGKLVFDYKEISKLIKRDEKIQTFFGKDIEVNYFRFDYEFLLKIRRKTSHPHLDLKILEFEYYPLLKRRKDSKVNRTNLPEIYALFKRDSKFKTNVQKLIDNFRKYYFVVSDIPSINCDINIFDWYDSRRELYSSTINELIDINPFEISCDHGNYLHKIKRKTLVISLANPILCWDLCFLIGLKRAVPLVILDV